jgi:hypothetical protein
MKERCKTTSRTLADAEAPQMTERRHRSGALHFPANGYAVNHWIWGLKP